MKVGYSRHLQENGESFPLRGPKLTDRSVDFWSLSEDLQCQNVSYAVLISAHCFS